MLMGNSSPWQRPQRCLKPQPQPRICPHSNEDLHLLLLWGNPAPSDSGGLLDGGHIARARGILPRCRGSVAPAASPVSTLCYQEAPESRRVSPWAFSSGNNHRLTVRSLLLCLWGADSLEEPDHGGGVGTPGSRGQGLPFPQHTPSSPVLRSHLCLNQGRSIRFTKGHLK